MVTDQQRIDMVRSRGEVPESWSDEKVLKHFRIRAAMAAARLEQMGLKR